MTKSNYYVHPSSIIDKEVIIGKGTKIWHFSHLLSGAVVGKDCTLGQNVSVAGGVTIGNNVKIQNNVSVYQGVCVEDNVFLGPSCVFTNVTNPRSEIVRKDYYEKTLVKKGATIGANATILCGIVIGRFAFVGAGAVVTHDVPDYTIVVGVPSKKVGWISRHGHVLDKLDKNGIYTCPESGLQYKETDQGKLVCIDIRDQDDLPEDKKQGTGFYRDYK
ncbi:MAG: N-acetyltransferase [Desulfobacteraceae bacterium]|nr:N-acetyltransferase [Desulfobacteraceae bacterium]